MGRGGGAPQEGPPERNSVRLGLHPHRGALRSWFRGPGGTGQDTCPAAQPTAWAEVRPERGGSFGGRTRRLSGFLESPSDPRRQARGADLQLPENETPDPRPVGTWAPRAPGPPHRVPHTTARRSPTPQPRGSPTPQPGGPPHYSPRGPPHHSLGAPHTTAGGSPTPQPGGPPHYSPRGPPHHSLGVPHTTVRGPPHHSPGGPPNHSLGAPQTTAGGPPTLQSKVPHTTAQGVPHTTALGGP